MGLEPTTLRLGIRSTGARFARTGLVPCSEVRLVQSGIGNSGTRFGTRFLASLGTPGAPERRLPDARLPAEHERARRRGLVVDERQNLAELVLPAEGRCAHALDFRSASAVVPGVGCERLTQRLASAADDRRAVRDEHGLDLEDRKSVV